MSAQTWEPEWEGEWIEDPPPRQESTRRLWPRRLEPLRENPGRWARFGPYEGSGVRQLASRMRGGRYGDGFDAYTSREDGSHWLYVSFVGETE